LGEKNEFIWVKSSLREPAAPPLSAGAGAVLFRQKAAPPLSAGAGGGGSVPPESPAPAESGGAQVKSRRLILVPTFRGNSL